MKFLFWLGLLAETGGLFWYTYQVWIVYSGQSKYEASYYPDLYWQNLIPAVLLLVIVVAAAIARFYFHQTKIATYVVFSPLAILLLVGIGMVLSSMFIKDWR